MKFNKTTLIVLAALVALGRMWIVPRLNVPTLEGTYEALAHMIVGFLILVPFYDPEDELGPSTFYGWLGWTLGLWELGWFLVQKFHLTI